MRILNRRSVIFIVIGILCACVLLFMGGNEKNNNPEKRQYVDYEEKAEQKLTLLISELEGVSDVKVMVTTECGTEYVYAVNSEHTDGGERTEYYSAGDEEALLLKEMTPKIKGVAVVCKGGDNMTVKTKIIQLVSSVLDLPSNRIFVGS